MRPSNPLLGEMYFDSNVNMMFCWDGHGWMNVSMQSQWILFIDDLRMPADAQMARDAAIARTYDEAIWLMDLKGLPSMISFDHDLGEGQPPATQIMWYLIHGHMDKKWDCSTIQTVQIHSANPVGAKNLQLLWYGFCIEFNLSSFAKIVTALEKT